MKKNTLLIFSLLLFYLYPAFASVEVRSNKLTTGDGLANNSIRYGVYLAGYAQRIKLL